MKYPKGIIIVSHTMLYGVAHALRDYLLNKSSFSLLFISLPFYDQRIASCTNYQSKKMVNEKSLKRLKRLGMLDYIIDTLLVVWWVFRQNKTYSLYIGVNPLNCIVGLLFKKIGKVEKVFFYAIDFTPQRFKNNLVNTLYHRLEIFCVMHADETWNVSPRIAEGREKFLQLSSKRYSQKVVPIGIWLNKMKRIPFEKIKKHQVLFVGHLLEKQGVQLVLEAIPTIIKKIPDFIFLIVGGGEYEEKLQYITSHLGIDKHVVFKGWVRDREELDKMMSESACAIAVYKPEEEKLYNFTYYADPTKLKDYLGAGLPIILTDIPYNARDIQKEQCGIIVDYNSQKITDAVILLLLNIKILKEYKENTFHYAKRFDWEKIFDTAFA